MESNDVGLQRAILASIQQGGGGGAGDGSGRSAPRHEPLGRGRSGMAQWAVSTSGGSAARRQENASDQTKRPPWGGNVAISSGGAGRRPAAAVTAPSRHQSRLQPPPPRSGTLASDAASAARNAPAHRPAPPPSRATRHPVLEAIADVQSGAHVAAQTRAGQPMVSRRQDPAAPSPPQAPRAVDPSSAWRMLSGSGSFSCSASGVCTLDSGSAADGRAACVFFRDGVGPMSGFAAVKSGRYKMELALRSGHAPQGSGRHAAFVVGLYIVRDGDNNNDGGDDEVPAALHGENDAFEMVCVRGDCVRREWTLGVVKSRANDIHLATVGVDNDREDDRVLRHHDADLRPNVWRHVAIEVRGTMLSLVSDGKVVFERVHTGHELRGPIVMAASKSKQLWRNLRIEAAPEGETELSYLRTSICSQADPSSSASAADRMLAGEDPHLVECIERDILMRSPNVSFDDIASLEDAKRVLDEAVRLPLIIPEFFTGIREPWQGVLLFGPAGTGKTLLAKAVAAMGGVTFFNCGCSTLTSKYRGESEKLVRCLFRLARLHAPSIIFFDEVDALVSSRGADGEHEASRRFKSELLSQMDGIAAVPVSGSGSTDVADTGNAAGDDCGGGNVMVLATTNSPWDLDDAMRRRLEKRIYVPLPDRAAREQMFSIHLRGVALADDLRLEALADETAGFSGADIKCACRDASLMPMRRLVSGKTTHEIKAMKDRGELDRAQITAGDFKTALARTSASVAASDVAKYEKWEADFANK